MNYQLEEHSEFPEYTRNSVTYLSLRLLCDYRVSFEQCRRATGCSANEGKTAHRDASSGIRSQGSHPSRWTPETPAPPQAAAAGGDYAALHAQIMKSKSRGVEAHHIAAAETVLKEMRRQGLHVSWPCRIRVPRSAGPRTFLPLHPLVPLGSTSAV